MGKTKEFFKKIGDIKGIFHVKMGMIKDRCSKDLTEVEGIKKRWREYTEALCKKCHNDPDKQDGVVTYLEPDMLDCEVKQALGSITLWTKLVEVISGIPTELFQILKDDAVKVLYSMYQQIWKTQRWPQEKVSFHFNTREGQCQRILKLL